MSVMSAVAGITALGALPNAAIPSCTWDKIIVKDEYLESYHDKGREKYLIV